MNSTSPASPKNPAFNVRRFVLTLALVAIVGGIVAIIALGKNGAGIGAAPAAATAPEQAATATPAAASPGNKRSRVVYANAAPASPGLFFFSKQIDATKKKIQSWRRKAPPVQ